MKTDLLVARLFRQGLTRKEIAGCLAISLSTVDWAIRKYVKPGGRK